MTLDTAEISGSFFVLLTMAFYSLLQDYLC